MDNINQRSEDIFTLLIKPSYKAVKPEDVAFLSELCHNSLQYFTPKDSGSYTEAIARTIQNNISGIGYTEAQNIANSLNENIAKEQLEIDAFNVKAKERGLEEAIYDSLKLMASGLSTIPQLVFYSNLDLWLSEANIALKGTCETMSGMVNMNPQLHGFIAEKMHELTFNLNAALSNSPYRAKVLIPDGSAYAKNSVDIVIKDFNGENIRRYQVKYCKDEMATNHALDSGDYRGQHPLVPSDQAPKMSRNVSDVIQSPDGVSSRPLSYEESKRLQYNVQNTGDPGANKLDISDFDIRELSKKMAAQVGYTVLIGAAVSAIIETVRQVSTRRANKDDNIFDGEVLKDVGLAAAKGAGKAASIALVSAVLQISKEKGILFENCSNESLAAIAIAITECGIIGYQMASGELSVLDGLNKIEVTASAVCLGYLSSSLLSDSFGSLGTSVGTILCPGVGTVIGGCIGEILGYAIGYLGADLISQTVVPELQAIRNDALIKISEMVDSFVTEAHIKNVEHKYCLA